MAKGIMSDVKEVVQSMEAMTENGKEIINGINSGAVQTDSSVETLCGASSDVVISSTFISTSKRLIYADAIFTALIFVLCWVAEIKFGKNTSYLLTPLSGIFISHLSLYSAKSFLEKAKGVNNPDTVVNPNSK